jgi:diguanylate cyclase with PAS/PAC sensor
MGDRVLKTVANTFVSAIRKTDFVGRWGGEEFIGIFPMANKMELEIIGEKIRVLVENSVLREEDGKKYSITVSIGGAVLTEEDSIKSLIKRADENMYISKKSGKNMVTIG